MALIQQASHVSSCISGLVGSFQQMTLVSDAPTSQNTSSNDSLGYFCSYSTTKHSVQLSFHVNHYMMQSEVDSNSVLPRTRRCNMNIRCQCPAIKDISLSATSVVSVEQIHIYKTTLLMGELFLTCKRVNE